MRRGHLLDEQRRALLGAKRRDQYRQERTRADAELDPERVAIRHRRIGGNATGDHADRLAAIAVAHQLIDLTQSHCDDGVRPRSHRAQQEPLVPAERSQPKRVVAEVLGDYVSRTLPSGYHVADQVRADATGHDSR
jgi:hypothetical protein